MTREVALVWSMGHPGSLSEQSSDLRTLIFLNVTHCLSRHSEPWKTGW